MDLLVAFGRARDGDEYRRQCRRRAPGCAGSSSGGLRHLLGVAVNVETIASIEDRDWRWFIGLDSEAHPDRQRAVERRAAGRHAAERIVALMRLNIEDTRLVDERVGNKPVYLILAMGADKVVRLKPQNLVAGLPLAATANVA